MSTVLILGATGIMGELIAREAARRDLKLVLAGRDANRLIELANSFDPGQASAAIVDVGVPATLESILARVDVVVNTVGPFSRLAGSVIDACLAVSVTLVTGAGFGVVATETLAIMLERASSQPLRKVQVLAAPTVAYASPAVQVTVQEALAEGSARHVNGVVQRGPLADGATTLDVAGRAWRVIAAPAGDLVAAQRATGAPDVVAYAPVPSERPTQQPASAEELRSYAWAAATDAAGRELEAHLTFGEGFHASAAIAVDVVLRILAAPRPGAWTPGQLSGVDVALACGADIRESEAR